MNYTNFIEDSKLYKSVSAFLIVVILMWACGMPAWINYASAANLTTVSDTIIDSDLSVQTNHTIVFTTPTGVSADGSTITITFPAGFNMGSVGEDDIDIATSTGDLTTAADCTGADMTGISVAGQIITIEICNGDGGAIGTDQTVTVEIGTNATAHGVGANRIQNPGTAQSYEILIGGTMTDSGALRVAIIDDVVVTAAVSTRLTFTIEGVNAGVDINGDTTDATSTATSMPFGTLDVDTPKVVGQKLLVQTNANNGFTVTVVQDENLTSASTADIDLFANGGASSTPVAWEAPVANVTNEKTWGHYGITSEDESLFAGDDFGSQLYAGNIDTAREVFYHGGPANATAEHIGTTEVAIRIEVSSLQEAANDYTNVLTYVCTPVF